MIIEWITGAFLALILLAFTIASSSVTYRD